MVQYAPGSMSQIPPDAAHGWVDPYGNHQPGAPPAGYWQANDGRWYPPSPPSAAETQIAPTTTAQPTTPQPGPVESTFQPPQPGSAHGSGPVEPPTFQPPAPAPLPQQFPPAGPPPSQFPAPSAPPTEPPSPFASPTAPPGAFPAPGSGPPLSPPPGFAPPPSQGPRSRTGLYAALALIALLFAGCTTVGIIALNRADDAIDTAIDELTTTTELIDDGSSTSSAPASTDDATATSEPRSLAGVTTSAPQGAGSGDAVGCTLVNSETIVLEVVNSAATVQSYFLTVAFFDGEQRLGDTIAFVNNLRPGERTIESSFIFDQEGSRCEVIEADTFPAESDPAHLADVSPCTITGVDFANDVTAELTATNSSSTTSDYSIQVAFVDPDGIRRGTGFSNVESVRPGETAPADVFSFVEDRPDLVCQVVGVDRIAS